MFLFEIVTAHVHDMTSLGVCTKEAIMLLINLSCELLENSKQHRLNIKSPKGQLLS